MGEGGEVGGGRGRVEAGREVPQRLIADEEDLQEDDEGGGGVERDGFGDPQHDGHEEHAEHAMAGFGQPVEIQEPGEHERHQAEGEPQAPPIPEGVAAGGPGWGAGGYGRSCRY